MSTGPASAASTDQPRARSHGGRIGWSVAAQGQDACTARGRLPRLGGNDIVGIHRRAACSPASHRPEPAGRLGRVRSMFTGFKNFLMRGDIVVVAVGLAVALAFSALIASFTANIINPIVTRAQGGHAAGLGVQLGNAGNKAT